MTHHDGNLFFYQAAARLRGRWVLLLCAMVLAICALPLPATSEQVPLVPLHYMPVLLIPVGDVVALISGNFGIALLATLPAQLCFVLTPLLIAVRPRALWAAMIRWLLVLGLLGIWTVPAVAAVSARLHPRFAHDEIRIGYYIYAIAHTVAFIACLRDPLLGAKSSSKAGFPIFPLNKSNGGVDGA